MEQSPSIDQTAHVGPPPRIGYHGKLGEAWRIALTTTLLTLVTFGVYRFWAKTRLRRYFWSRVSVNDEPLEYSGTGLELFLGFLIVLLILGPAYGLMYFGQLLATDRPGVAVALSFLPALLVPVAIFRARRYRLSRTLWRGVRAGQTGRVRDYWIRAVGYGGASFLTLWLLRPLAHARLNSFLMEHTWFGQERFHMHLRARDLMARWLVVWVAYLIAVGSCVGAAAVVAMQVQSMTAPGGPGPDLETLIAGVPTPMAILAGFGFIAAWLAWGMAYVWYRVTLVRLSTAETTLAGLRFQSGLRFWRVIGVAAVLAIVYVAVLGGAAALGGAIFGETGAFAGFLLGGLAAGTLTAPFVTHPLLAHFIETLEIEGSIDLDAVAQNPETAPKLGEGLASAFDVDAM